MRILLADDHALFRQGMRLVLERIFHAVEIVDSASVESALAVLKESSRFDLVLLDLAMPGMTGTHEDDPVSRRFQGITRLRNAAPGVPVVIISAHASPAEITQSLRLGVRGYIPKSASLDVLRHALLLVLSGEIYVPPNVIDLMHQRINDLSGESDAQGTGSSPLAQLTPRQRATLDLMMLGKSNKEIAQDLAVLESTVKAHVRVILQKLHASNRTQAVRIATDLGWGGPEELMS